jgi:hypothetical protein
MGYNTLNGASATAISALHKYGLLERAGDEIKVSERALRILHPHSPQEKADAIRAAAGEPVLFAELAERFPGALPNEDLLRNYLLRQGFATGAVGVVIAAYRDTSDMVAAEGRGYDSAHSTAAQESSPITPLTTASAGQPGHHGLHAQNLVIGQYDGRQIGRYDFEEGGFVKITASPEIDTEEALSMVETIVQLKRKEIERRKQRIAIEASGKFDPDEPGNE